jgi:hypothetical protein
MSMNSFTGSNWGCRRTGGLRSGGIALASAWRDEPDSLTVL